MNDRVFRRHRLFFAILALLAAGSSTTRAQALALFGTWKLNPAKSTLAGPPPLEILLLFVPFGADQIAGGEDTTYPDGSKTTSRYTLKADGHDTPILASPEILVRADTISLSRVDSSTFMWIYKKDGLPVLSLRGVISQDGRALAMTSPDGQVLYYEKQ